MSKSSLGISTSARCKTAFCAASPTCSTTPRKTAHDENVDQYRIQSVMQLRAEPEIKDYILSLGIKTSLGPVRVPARKDSLMLGRICFPVRSQGILLGYLWLIDDDESLTEQEIDESARVAAVVGEILLRNQLTDDLRRTREREPLLDLVNDASTFHDHLTTEALSSVGLERSMHCRLVVVQARLAGAAATSEDGVLVLESALRRGLRPIAHVRCLVMSAEEGRGYVLVAYRSFDDPTEQVVEAARSIREELVAAYADQEILVAVGPAVTSIDDATISI